MREREVTLAAPAGFRAPGFGASGLRTVSLEPRRLQTTYHDTPDLRLGRWGCSLRFRSGEGWTLKLPSDGSGPLLVRSELLFPGAAAAPPPEALDLVRAYVRRSPVGPVARLRTLRYPVRIEDGEGRPVGELVLDEVSVLDGRRVAQRFREIEVELLEDVSPKIVEGILAALRAAGAGAPDPTPKYRRAMGPHAFGPPEVELGKPGPGGQAAEVVRLAVAASVDRLLRHDPGVRAGEDPEAVHQARVATRRLRSDLRTFRSLLDAAWAEVLREELAWVAGLLGAARDADVLLARLRGRVEMLPEGDRPHAGKLVVALERGREEAGGALLDAMRQERYLDLVERLLDAARSPVLLPEASAPAAGVLPALLAKPWCRLVRAVERAGRAPSDEQLHDVRIMTKRCRYAAEALAGVLGKPAVRFAKAAAALQDVLGEHQDAVVSGRWLREHGLGAAAPEAFAAGELAGMERAAAEEARRRWAPPWKALRRAARGLER